jgi:hypothetical protein
MKDVARERDERSPRIPRLQHEVHGGGRRCVHALSLSKSFAAVMAARRLHGVGAEDEEAE